jgi:hypothetical protein
MSVKSYVIWFLLLLWICFITCVTFDLIVDWKKIRERDQGTDVYSSNVAFNMTTIYFRSFLGVHGCTCRYVVQTRCRSKHSLSQYNSQTNEYDQEKIRPFQLWCSCRTASFSIIGGIETRFRCWFHYLARVLSIVNRVYRMTRHVFSLM